MPSPLLSLSRAALEQEQRRTTQQNDSHLRSGSPNLKNQDTHARVLLDSDGVGCGTGPLIGQCPQPATTTCRMLGTGCRVGVGNGWEAVRGDASARQQSTPFPNPRGICSWLLLLGSRVVGALAEEGAGETECCLILFDRSNNRSLGSIPQYHQTGSLVMCSHFHPPFVTSTLAGNRIGRMASRRRHC